MKRTEIIHEAIGWIGAVSLFVAYLLISQEKLHGTDVIYQVLQIIGAYGITHISFIRKAFAPGTLNLFWMIAAIYFLFRIIG